MLKFANLIIPNSDYAYAKVNQRQILEKDVYVKNHQRYEIHPMKADMSMLKCVNMKKMKSGDNGKINQH